MISKVAASTRLLLACILLAPPGIASAAEISAAEINDGIAIIRIDGEITSGDLEKFRQISIQYKNAAVILNSDGGELLPAIEIGKIIRIAGFLTGVEQVCASSCALIWLAGTKRAVKGGGQVGFHASYRDNNGRLEESGVANALIGSYLTLLNYPEKAIVFATRASPREILWLTQANRASSGIEFEYLNADGTEAALLSPPPIRVTNSPIPPPTTQRPIQTAQQRSNVRQYGLREAKLLNVDEFNSQISLNYPEYAVRNGIVGRVSIEVAVSSNGRPSSCAVIVGSRTLLDEVACNDMMRFGTFEPPLNDQGVPVAGTYNAAIIYEIEFFENGWSISHAIVED